MMSKWFAVGAALLAGLIPWVARADLLIDFRDSISGTITFTSLTSFSGSGDLSGDADYKMLGTVLDDGGYVIPDFSVTALPATSPVAFFFYDGASNATLNGTVDWTAVEGYPTSPELIGTFTVVGVLVPDPSAPLADFAAGFPVGSIDQISISLGSTAASCSEALFEPPCLGIVSGEIVTPTPEPATLSILGAALGIFLMARRAVRHPPEGPSEDLARA
jgi:hypothetical protein